MSFITGLVRVAIIVLTGFTTNLLWSHFRSPIKHFPGPFVAKFTNLWRFIDVYRGRAELTHRELHKKHGVAVQLGPNLISLSDPKLLRTVYNIRGDFVKSQFYSLSDTKHGASVIENIFSTRSNEFHAQQRRLLQKLYHMPTILSFEPLVDATISTFCERLEQEYMLGVNQEKACPINQWLGFFAWEVVGQTTFSTSMGFLDSSVDSTSLLMTAEKNWDYLAVIGQIPSLDYLLAKNPVCTIAPAGFDYAVRICAQKYIERKMGTDSKMGEQRDMLDSFISFQESDPEHIDDNRVVSDLMINFVSSDTTAILLRTIVDHVCKDLDIMRKLQRELDAADLTMLVRYSTAVELPYLDAVVNESMRFHPGVGLILERIVPKGGLKLSDGRFVPQGTIVGMNAWVVHQDKAVFGQDFESFNPNRWLRDVNHETSEAYNDRLKRMKNADLFFGAGNRVCIGKNMSILATYKLVATLFNIYDICLVDPEKKWHIQNSWFVRQSGIKVKLRRRK